MIRYRNDVVAGSEDAASFGRADLLRRRVPRRILYECFVHITGASWFGVLWS